MAFGNGPRIVTNGLVLSLDAGDSNSYPGSGTTWRDLSGNNNSGSLINGPTFNSANAGSIIFDGVDDYFQTSTSPITINSSSFTIECFIRFSNFNNGNFFPIIDGGNYGGSDPAFGRQVGYTLSKNNANRLYLAADGGYVEISTSITNNQWYHIIGTATYGNPYSLSLFVNGTSIPSSSGASTNTLTINQTSSRAARGYITTGLTTYGPFTLSTTRFYNRALSAAEVQQNYNAQKSRFGL